ncbi:MAG: DnaJ domain-containing protein [Acidithiobacillus sp.]|nr:DnaJ domain-containing protein [Acidithiobacillus sp.]
MSYFTPPFTRESIRQQYRELAKRYHPDINHAPDATAIMQAINAEYTRLMNAATREEMPGRSENSYSYQADTNERLRQEIEKAVRLAHRFNFLSIEVTGYWIWIHGLQRRGATPANDEAMAAVKALDYRYAPNKQLWYFPVIPCRHGRGADMDYIRSKYGSRFYAQAQAQDEEN